MNKYKHICTYTGTCGYIYICTYKYTLTHRENTNIQGTSLQGYVPTINSGCTWVVGDLGGWGKELSF